MESVRPPMAAMARVTSSRCVGECVRHAFEPLLPEVAAVCLQGVHRPDGPVVPLPVVPDLGGPLAAADAQPLQDRWRLPRNPTALIAADAAARPVDQLQVFPLAEWQAPVGPIVGVGAADQYFKAGRAPGAPRRPLRGP
jgi:hypothetical protein